MSHSDAKQTTISPAQVGGVESLAGGFHRSLLVVVDVRVQDNFYAILIPGDTTWLAIDHLGCFLQRQPLPLWSEIVLLDPIMQVAQENLQVQHDLVFLQVTFPAQRLGVNRVSCSNAFSELSSQLTGLGSVPVETREKVSLPLLKAGLAVRQFLSKPLQAIVTPLGGFT